MSGAADALETGWRRPTGCLKLQVIFCKRATNYRALLRKMISKDRAYYGSSTPCMTDTTAKATPPKSAALRNSFLKLLGANSS